MNLYIKQKVFSWNDKFAVYNENGEPAYFVEGEVFSFGKKLHLYDTAGTQLAFIAQKIASFLPKFTITLKDNRIAEVTKKFSLFRPEYTVKGPNWAVRGNFFIHEYQIIQNERPIAYITKEWLTWGDTYKISFNDDIEPEIILSIVLVIDACIDMEN